MSDGNEYITLIPVKKTVIKNSTIDFRDWRSKEGIGGSTYIDFNEANFESSTINGRYMFSSVEPLSQDPVILNFKKLVLDRTTIDMHNMDLAKSKKFTLDFYNYGDGTSPSTFRNSRLRLNAMTVAEHSEAEIYLSNCNWNNSTLRLDSSYVTATEADEGGLTTFKLNTDADQSNFNFQNAYFYNAGGIGNDIIINGTYDKSTISGYSLRLTRGPVQFGLFNISGDFVSSLIDIANQYITDYACILNSLNLVNSSIALQNFSNGTTAGTQITGTRITLENSQFYIDELVNSPSLDIQNVRISDSSPLTIQDKPILYSDTRYFYDYTSINNLVSIKVFTNIGIINHGVSTVARTLPSGFCAQSISCGRNLSYGATGGTNFIYASDANILTNNLAVNVVGLAPGAGPIINLVVAGVDFTGEIIPNRTIISFTYLYAGQKQYWAGLAQTVTYASGDTIITLYSPPYWVESSVYETLMIGELLHEKSQNGNSFSYLTGDEPLNGAKYLIGEYGLPSELMMGSIGSDASGNADFILTGRFIED